MPPKLDYPELTTARRSWRYTPDAGCLANKVILVTGAGDGIGRAAAKTFAVFGAHVVLLGKTRRKVEAVFDWITRNTETKPVIVPCDLLGLDESSATGLRDAIDHDYGRLDGVLHNASLLGPKVPIEHYPPADWQNAMQVNAYAPFLLTHTLLPLLQAGEGASIVMTSSTVGRQGRAYWGAYAVSKFALEGLMQVLADELENAGRVRVNSLNPGGTRTAMRREAYPSEDPQMLPLPESHMDLYLYLMSDASIGITGQAFDARTWQYSTQL